MRPPIASIAEICSSKCEGPADAKDARIVAKMLHDPSAQAQLRQDLPDLSQDRRLTQAQLEQRPPGEIDTEIQATMRQNRPETKQDNHE